MIDQLGPTIKQIPSENLPDNVKKSYFELVNEQIERLGQYNSGYWKNWDKSERLQYQKEDIMYIINKLTTMVGQAPKLQSSPIVQQKIKAQICK